MKLSLNQNGARGFKEACDKVLIRIARVKAAILAESRGLLEIHQHLVRLALNEAEALAWQTRFPHLVFPELAMEKVQNVVEWSQRQSRRRRGV